MLLTFGVAFQATSQQLSGEAEGDPGVHFVGNPKDYKVPSSSRENTAIYTRSVICCPLLAVKPHYHNSTLCRICQLKAILNVFSLCCPTEETEEHADLSKALAQIREVITAVDHSVSEYERHQRLQEVWSRMENRSVAKLKSGHTLRKQDMMGRGQTLKHQGLLLWKTATGRLKGETSAFFFLCYFSF